jgi:polyisoprenyl-teichoic acid--peptidoglycan teichoic acid transferase
VGKGAKQSLYRASIPPVIKKTKIVPQSVRRKSSLLKRLGLGVVFLGVTSIAAVGGLTLALITPFQGHTADGKSPSIAELFGRGLQYGMARPVNILMMGIDRVPEATPGSAEAFKGRSDTMLLVRLNPEDGAVSILSIPRDTRVNIPTIGMDKINAANAIGGPDLAATVVSRTLNNVSVDRYARIDTGAFRELVELVGGVEINVPKRMYYIDQTQKLKIDLQPGLQTLTGEQAEGFARFRYDELGDIGRAQRQQILLKALQKQLTNPMMLTRLPQLFGVMQKHIDSDLTLGEMLALVQFGMQLKPPQLRMVLLPGRFSGSEYEASYWIMDTAGMERVINNYFQSGGAIPTNSLTNPQDLRISVQNAARDPKAAQRMVDLLARHGYRNVEIDVDWPSEESITEVIVQQGDLPAAQSLQAALGMGRVQSDSTGTLGSDLTIRVGNDLAPFLANHPQ